VPLTIGLIFVLLYLNFRRLTDTLLVIGAIPFALIGGVVLLWALDYEFSVAVGAGFLALTGLTAETGVIMLLFLNQAKNRAMEAGALNCVQDLWHATVEGATYRARPLLMTVASDAIGLLPIMWGIGTGSETMRRIAAPIVGGVVTVTLVTLFVIPVLFVLVHGRALPKSAPGNS
jgi:Cu(I)/Ag(I) efflux system membrane protein CusA/SilA